MTRNKSSVGILGAGISGLSTAYALDKQGFQVSVYEKNDSVGGVIQSRQADGWLTELGPNTLMVRTQPVWDLLKDLGLTEDILEANKKAAKRFILKDDELMPLPSSLSEFVKTGLFSGGAKLRLFKEPFIGAGKENEENIANFVTRRLGKEVLDYAVNPFVAGIFAGDPEKLSLKHTFPKLHKLESEHGSLLKGMLKQKKKKSSRKALISFKNGLQTLPLAIHKELEGRIHLNREAVKLNYSEGSWQLHFHDGSHTEHDAIVATIPIPALRKIIADRKMNSHIIPMDEMYYAPMSVIHLGFRKEQVGHALDGFGMLIPEKEQGKLLGTLFSSTLFPGRAPDEYALLTSFIGGARDPDMAHQPADKLKEIAQAELEKLLGITGAPEFSAHTCWDNAIPQYELGYDQHLQAMKTAEEQFPGFYLAGSFRDGVSVPDCITSGLEKAGKIASDLER